METRRSRSGFQGAILSEFPAPPGWKRVQPAAGANWGQHARPLPRGTCLFSDVGGVVVGVVTEPVYYGRSLAQGWSAIRVYSPIGIIEVAGYSTLERDGPSDPYPRQSWYQCPKPKS